MGAPETIGVINLIRRVRGVPVTCFGECGVMATHLTVNQKIVSSSLTVHPFLWYNWSANRQK